MRIESLVSYKYYFRFIQEESLCPKPFSLLVILLIPIFIVFCLSGWDLGFLLFVTFGYCCVAIGFYLAYKSNWISFNTARQRIFQNIILNDSKDVVLLRSKTDKHITYANPAFYKLFNLDDQEERKYWFYEFIDAEDLHWFSPKKNRFRIKNISGNHPIIKIKRADGIICRMELEVREVENGDFFIYTLKDKTEQILREQANRQLIRDLLQRRNRVQRKKNLSNIESLSLKI